MVRKFPEWSYVPVPPSPESTKNRTERKKHDKNVVFLMVFWYPESTKKRPESTGKVQKNNRKVQKNNRKVQKTTGKLHNTALDSRNDSKHDVMLGGGSTIVCYRVQNL